MARFLRLTGMTVARRAARGVRVGSGVPRPSADSQGKKNMLGSFRRFLVIAAVSALLIAAGPPRAMAVVIDFDSLGSNVDVTNLFPEATFTSTGDRFVATGGTSLVHTAPNPISVRLGTGFDLFADLFVDFTDPVDNLTFYATAVNDGGVPAMIDVFENDVLSATLDLATDADMFTPDLQDLTAFSSVTRIRVHSITDFFGIAYDTFEFDIAQAPEPGTLGVLGAGLAALAIARRRRPGG